MMLSVLCYGKVWDVLESLLSFSGGADEVIWHPVVYCTLKSDVLWSIEEYLGGGGGGVVSCFDRVVRA